MKRREHKQLFQVSGMTCSHCKAAVESAMSSADGVQSVRVDLEAGKATVEGDFADEAVIEAVKDAGYQATISSD